MYIPSYSLYRFVNSYHGSILPLHQSCYDYVVSPHLFLKKEDALDKYNLIPCDRWTSVMRNGYAFGNIDLLQQKEYQTHDPYQWMHVSDIMGKTTGYVNKKNKIFYPSKTCERGMISRYLSRILMKYPYLSLHLPDIVKDTSILSEWNHYPITPFEKFDVE